MIGTIRKHSTWMWVIIIAVVIITFVFWGSQSSRQSGVTEPANYGIINGRPVSREAYADAQREVYLQFFFRHGDWPDQEGRRFGFDAERDTYIRLLLIQKLEQFGIRISEEAAATVAGQMLRSLNRGQPLPADVFAKQVLQPRRLTLADFQRYLQHELGIQQLTGLAGLGGRLVTPQEARALYEREHQEVSAQAVFFSASNYLSAVTATPEAIAQFYTNYMATYRLPERVQVSYVKFVASNYLAEATRQFAEITNLNEIVEAQYQRLGTNFFLEAKTPEEKKDKVRELMFKNQMLGNARKAANEFAAVLLDREPVRPGNLETVAGERGLPVQTSAAFDRENPPEDLKVGADFCAAAFGLTPEDPFAGPIMGEDAVYVIALHGRLPSENPPFETVRERVMQDFKFSQAAQMARQAGEEFHAAVTNELEAGKGFAAICVEAKVQPVLPPPLSLSTRSLPKVERHVSLYQFKQAVFTTAPGRASGFTPTRDGGFLVYVQAKFPLDETKLATELPGFMQSVRQTRQSEAFNLWFNQEAQRGLRDIPYFRQQQPPQMSGAARQ